MSSSAAQGSNRSSVPSTSSTISIPQTAAAGGISFTQPAETAQASFYKIASGQSITFGWNFTSLYVTPTSLTISAICENGNTYPVGPTDGVIPGSATSVVWDVFSYQQAHPTLPLAQASYTLVVADERGTSAPRLPGRFSPNTGLRFALYSPQPYTPLQSELWSFIFFKNFIHLFIRLDLPNLQWIHWVICRTSCLYSRLRCFPSYVNKWLGATTAFLSALQTMH